MRPCLMLAFPLLALAACADPVMKDTDGDTLIGVDEETGAEAAPDILVSTATLDLGDTAPGSARSGTFTVQNEGNAALASSMTVSSGADYFSIDTSAADLAPGGRQSVTVTFAADTVGSYAGTVTIVSDDPDEGILTVALSARVGGGSDDLDGDGYTAADGDCDDADAGVNPGAEETWYDGIDQDCDGASDYDQDADGYAAADYGGDDCDDLDPAVNGAADEVDGNGIDDDCDGEVDEAPSSEDADADGYTEASGDCDDTNPDAYTGAIEVLGNGIDDDCDGEVDEAPATTDLDGDGYTEASGDCDDSDASVNPAGTEVWYDGIDQDCDGNDLDQDGDGWVLAYDCDDTDAAINPDAVEVWYDGVDQDCAGTSDYDQDGDGHDSDAWGGDDCDDTDAAINPDAAETWYDGIDQDCDGNDLDQDGDGYTAAEYGGTDCDDTDATVSPGAAEIGYDGVDQDCDGASDYDLDGDGDDSDVYGGTDCNDADASTFLGAPDTWYDGVDSNCDGASDYDRDGDGYDSATYGGTDCNDLDPAVYSGAPDTWYDGVDSDCSGGSDYDQDGDGYVSSAYGGTDCDDLDDAVNPGAVEVWYDGTDSDCSGGSDYDQDGDGYTSGTYGGLDCIDTDASISPAAAEVCDGVDNDCDGSVDESGGSVYYLDGDGDGFGTSATTATGCTAPSGYVASSTDCLDSDDAVYPGATETCNGVDDDCDGAIDDGTGGTTYYADADGDGFGDAANSTTSCAGSLEGYVTDSTDCDDTSPTTYPGATELPYNVADDDCDDIQDEMLAESETDWTVLGVRSSDAIGNWGVEVCEDLDGDGDGELVIDAGSANTSSEADAGYIAFHDADDAGLSVALTDGYYYMYGAEGGDFFGSAFAVVDDLDGDGNVEVAIGSYRNDSNEERDGQVYIYDIDGATGSDMAISSDADGVVRGVSDDGYLGYALAAGDFDGDGVNDLAMGAPGEQSARGRVYVAFEGDDFGTDDIDADDASFYVTGVSSSDHLGYSVAFGDFGGDGYADLVACSPDDDDNGSASGTCWVIDGSSSRDGGGTRGTTVSSVDSAVVTGSAASDQAGYTPQSLAVGDLDGDGRDDLGVGVPGYDGAATNGGGVWVYAGGALSGNETVSTATWLVRGDGALGTAVHFADVTGDGTDDLLAGATTAGSGYGVLYLLEGGLSAGTYTFPTDQYASWTGESSGDLLGTAVSGVYDLDGDGRDELAVSATGNDDAASGAGKVYVLPAYP